MIKELMAEGIYFIDDAHRELSELTRFQEIVNGIGIDGIYPYIIGGGGSLPGPKTTTTTETTEEKEVKVKVKKEIHEEVEIIDSRR